MRLIASNGEFELHDREVKLAKLNLKLIRKTPKKVPKKNWWLSWNGVRLGGGRDIQLLAEYEPEIYQWVVQTLDRRNS